jgi:hypothetical protein
MAPVFKRRDDVVIHNRSGLDSSSNSILEVYEVVCPALNATAGKFHSYSEAESTARRIAEDHAVSVWLETGSGRAEGTLVASYRQPQ